MVSMKKVKVELGSASYEVRIGTGLLDRSGLWLKEKGLSGKAAVITDATVNDLYGDTLNKGLKMAGFNVTNLVVPAGEEQKSLETVRLPFVNGYGPLSPFFMGD